MSDYEFQERIARVRKICDPHPDRIDIEARDKVSFEWQQVRNHLFAARAAIAKAKGDA